ncbi:GTP cyclohydrolase [Streptacidiphilus sp. 4-A2]|nr:GTP cyclohydrolase [Streptacidiphilus sp. 4-A2]
MFIITIHYTTDDLQAVAALRPEHYAYLGPHFESGLFLLGGRLVPDRRVMIAQGGDRDLVERLFAGEPYYLATYSITEIMPTKVGQALAGIIEPQPI